MVGRQRSVLPSWYIEYSDRCGCNQRLTEMTKNIVQTLLVHRVSYSDRCGCNQRLTESYYTFDYFYKTEVLKKDAEEMEKPFSLTGLPLQDLGPYRSSPSCSRSAIVRGSEHRLVIQCCGLLSLCPSAPQHRSQR